MPTPSPIMRARVAPTEGISSAMPKNQISESPRNSPMTAEMSGIPTAMRLPKAISRMMAAAAMPSCSLVAVSVTNNVLPIGPPTAAFIPCACAGWTAMS